VKIAYVATSDMTLEYQLKDQIRHLISLGHDVSAVSASGPWVAGLRASGFKVHTVPLTRRIDPLGDLRAFGALVALFARLRPDAVHTQTPKASLIGQWAALVARVPYRLHTVFGLYFPGHMRPRDRWFYVLLERLQMAPADIVLSQNAEDMETCRRERICDPARLRYLGNGVDIDRYHPRNAAPERALALRTSLGIPADHQVVGLVGRLVREKGYLEFLDAAVRILKQRPKTTFLAIGPHEPWKADALSDDDIHSRGLGDALHLLGHREDIAELYGMMDVFVLPSHREGFPRSPMEASATGVPVVATDIRGCRETVVEGENGFLVPVRDDAALASKILRLLDDRELRDRMRRRAREIAVERFDQRVVFDRVADAYASLQAR
jgi:glycosyltransferase involved in cell wall biosynthesis